jgi:hypothetical protein
VGRALALNWVDGKSLEKPELPKIAATSGSLAIFHNW